MNVRRVLLCLTPLLCLLATSASAEEVVEAWRSPFGTFRSLSVNHADGSCWASSGATVLRLGADGEVFVRVRGFAVPGAIAANPSDGSCWVADKTRNDLVHLALDGAELLRIPDLTADLLAVNSTDGSCWVAHVRGYQLVHVAQNGTELWRGDIPYAIESLAVNSTDGSCWLIAGGLLHLAQDGSEVWRAEPEDYSVNWFLSVAVDSTNGSCWVGADNLLHLAADGTELWRSAPESDFLWPVSVSVDPSDSSCWVADLHYSDAMIVHLAADGTELLRATGFRDVRYVSADPTEGSCWLIDQTWYAEGHGAYLGAYEGPSLRHLAGDGAELWRGESWEPGSLSVNALDGSCWVVDRSHYQVVHLADDGAEIGRVAGYLGSLSVNSTDSSWWAAGGTTDGWIAHVATDGTELLMRTGFAYPNSVSVNPADGSCWLAGGYRFSTVSERPTEVERAASRTTEVPSLSSTDPSGRPFWVYGLVAHLAQDGTELWRREQNFVEARSISVNPVDGSAWVSGGFGLAHLTEDGTEVLRSTDFGEPVGVSVNPVDGSCWVAARNLYRLADDGVPLWSQQDRLADSVSVNPVDGSCWVAQRLNAGGSWYYDAVLHLAEDGSELWQNSTGFYGPVRVSANPTDGSCWVADTGNRQLVRLVVVGYQAPPFADVPAYFWAYHEIGACFESGIVSGYDQGRYHPDWCVSRDQMAVFISRTLAGGHDNVPDGPATPTFDDVAADYWAYDCVEYAVEHNIVIGYPDGLYHPTDPVTRGQMAVFVSRALVSPSGDAAVPAGPAEATFPDVTSDNEWFWCYDNVEHIAVEGVTQGYAYDGNYHPECNCSRDQMAVYLQRAFDLPM